MDETSVARANFDGVESRNLWPYCAVCKSDQVIRENPASRGTEASAEVLVSTSSVARANFELTGGLHPTVTAPLRMHAARASPAPLGAAGPAA